MLPKFCPAALPGNKLGCTLEKGHEGEHVWDAERWEEFLDMWANEILRVRAARRTARPI